MRGLRTSSTATTDRQRCACGERTGGALTTHFRVVAPGLARQSITSASRDDTAAATSCGLRCGIGAIARVDRSDGGGCRDVRFGPQLRLERFHLLVVSVRLLYRSSCATLTRLPAPHSLLEPDALVVHFAGAGAKVVGTVEVSVLPVVVRLFQQPLFLVLEILPATQLRVQQCAPSKAGAPAARPATTASTTPRLIGEGSRSRRIG